MDEKIAKFIDSQYILTLGVNGENGAYLCSCFYAFLKPNLVIVAFGDESYHSRVIQNDNRVFINIALQTKVVGKIQGLQASGTIHLVKDKIEENAYISRFAYAKLVSLNLYKIELKWLKFTDNTLGFGKKIEIKLT